MPDFDSGFGEAPARDSYAGTTPAAPTPSTLPTAALATGAPTLGLGFANIIIIVSGDVNVTSTFPGGVVQRR